MFIRAATVLLALAVSGFVDAAPIFRRQGGGTPDPNLLVLQFAEVLQQLEGGFYNQALQKFQEPDFLAAGFGSASLPIQQFQKIAGDEQIHDTTLLNAIQALGGSPITGCQFNFGPALSSLPVVAATARVVENVGVGAFLGGAALLNNTNILEAAASIVTVEARHQTILNLLNGRTSIPSPFDIALTPPEVLAIAGPFISGCTIPIQANMPVAVTNNGTIGPGALLQITSPAITGSTDGLFCQMLFGGASAPIILPLNACVVPQQLNGPVAVWVTPNNTPLPTGVSDRSKATITAGPAMIFVDSEPDALGTLVKTQQVFSAGSSSNGGSSSNNGANTTTTISGDVATSIIASISSASAASATPTAGSSGGSQTTVTVAPLFTSTGNSPDGAISVQGVSSVTPSPAPTGSANSSSSSSSSASATDSASAAVSVVGTSSVTPSPTVTSTMMSMSTDSASSSTTMMSMSTSMSMMM